MDNNPVLLTDILGLSTEGWIKKSGSSQIEWDPEINTEGEAIEKWGDGTVFYENGYILKSTFIHNGNITGEEPVGDIELKDNGVAEYISINTQSNEPIIPEKHDDSFSIGHNLSNETIPSDGYQVSDPEQLKQNWGKSEHWEKVAEAAHFVTVDLMLLIATDGLLTPTKYGTYYGSFSRGITKPNGQFYSVAFETTLSSNLYPGVNASRHLTAANKAMLSTMDDVTMKNLNIVMKTRSNGSIIMNSSPHNWVWHHDIGTGVMQLVPKAQHTPGSIFWNTLHPGGQGGMSIWGGGY
jgi:hypothetical protein